MGRTEAWRRAPLETSGVGPVNSYYAARTTANPAQHSESCATDRRLHPSCASTLRRECCSLTRLSFQAASTATRVSQANASVPADPESKQNTEAVRRYFAEHVAATTASVRGDQVELVRYSRVAPPQPNTTPVMECWGPTELWRTRLLWELYELGFMYELLDLDKYLQGLRGDGLGRCGDRGSWRGGSRGCGDRFGALLEVADDVGLCNAA